jgi:hypothetical protein
MQYQFIYQKQKEQKRKPFFALLNSLLFIHQQIFCCLPRVNGIKPVTAIARYKGTLINGTL